MKIGINATILDKKPTGLGVFTVNIINELANDIEKDDEVVVYTSEPSYFKESNVTVKKVTSFVQPRYGKVAGVIRFIWLQCVFPFLVKRDRCDIVYSTTHHGNIFITKKQILTIHDLLAIKFPNQYKLQNIYFKYVTPLLLSKSPYLYTVSQNTKKDIENIYHYDKEKIETIYNSYDSSHFYPQKELKFKKKYGNYLLFLGASYPHKNVVSAIKAFLKFTEMSQENIKLLVVNRPNEYLKSVKQKFSGNFDFEKNVLFLDYASYHDLPILYSNATALFYPSLYEGFGIPPLEAMACGCPVIVSNNSSLPEVCGDSALYIDPKSEESMVEGIKNLLNNDELRIKLSEKGLAQASKFSWEKSALKLYKSLKKNTN
jgi:glycosyltransferase involved in cell wall biosynthesis